MRNELRLRALRVIKASLRGRTGAALCRLCGQLLLYGGTLNGNFGPVLGDVLRLNYGATAASLAVREVVVTPGAVCGVRIPHLSHSCADDLPEVAKDLAGTRCLVASSMQ